MQRPVIYQQQLWAAPSLSSPFLWLALVESNLLAAVESARPWGATGADKPKGGRGLRLQAEQQDVAFQPARCQEKSLRGNPDLKALVFNNFTKYFNKAERKAYSYMQSGSIIFGLSNNLLGLLLFPHSSDGQGCNNLSLQSFCLKTDVSPSWCADKTTWG